MINNFLWFISGFGVCCGFLGLILFYVFVSQDDEFYSIDYFEFSAPNDYHKFVRRERVKNLKFKKNFIKFVNEDNISCRVNYVYFISSMKEGQ